MHTAELFEQPDVVSQLTRTHAALMANYYFLLLSERVVRRSLSACVCFYLCKKDNSVGRERKVSHSFRCVGQPCICPTQISW